MFGFGNSNNQQANQNNQQQQNQNAPAAPQRNFGSSGNNQNLQNRQQQPNQNQNGVVNNNVDQNPNDQNLPPDPLARFDKMWDTANADSNGKPPAFQVDPKVLGEISGSLNFTDGIPQELMQQATSGDMNALIKMMNIVGQRAYQTSVQHQSALTDKFVSLRSDYDSQRLAPKVKEQLTSNALSGIKNFNHPVVRKQLNETANRLQAQYPDASPQEIAQMAAEYITELAGAISNPEQNPNGAGSNDSPKETDWGSYLGLDKQAS